jgi:imidazole glycerol-phosphate synthase subunit HisH
MTVIAVVDYDMGNLHSACKGLENAGATTQVTDSMKVMEQADAVVLPGVGAFDPAIQHLRSRDLIQPIKDIIASGKPFLGICLGLHILFDGSEEGNEPGLGVIPGMVRRFHSEPGLTIPHMGWNQLQLTQTIPLWQQLPADPWMYFVHSFYADPVDAKMNAATITHGTQTVTAAISCSTTGSANAHQNLMATQFHPEKSSTSGLQVLSNFVTLVKNQQLVGAN